MSLEIVLLIVQSVGFVVGFYTSILIVVQVLNGVAGLLANAIVGALLSTMSLR